MGDITSTRPASGAPIATAWGAEVHDQIEGIQAGSAAVTFSGSTASNTVVVTFPRAYAAPPIVVVSLGVGAAAWAVVSAVTATSVSLQGRAPSSIASGSFAVNWLAIGTPA